ncbi:MFS transporter [Desulfospira joergensenii]|uniref:MFS transporter n=1 Tax=Desulfospira joergensenii TaxID=53329 RepID=UPI0003FD02C2|nr:MFS transporter [Desulfospira joergensenii]
MLKYKILPCLAGSVFLMMVGVGMIVAELPRKIIELTGSGDLVGFLASSFAVSYVLFQVPLGSLADRIGFKPLLFGGYLICVCTGVLYYSSQSLLLIFTARFFQGLGEIPVWALAPALLSIGYPLAKGRAMGIYNAALHLGLTLGPVLGILLGSLIPRDLKFLVYAGLCFLGAWGIQAGIPNLTPGRGFQKTCLSPKEMIPILSQSMPLITLSGVSLYGAGYGIFITVLPVFLISEKGFSPFDVNLFFSAFYVGLSFSQVITGRMSDIFGRKGFMIFGLTLASVSLSGALFLEPCIVLLGISSLGFGAFSLSSLAFLSEMVEDSLRGTVSGAYFLFWGLGYFSGPLIINGLDCFMEIRHAFLVFSFSLLIPVFLWFIFMGAGRFRNRVKKEGV